MSSTINNSIATVAAVAAANNATCALDDSGNSIGDLNLRSISDSSKVCSDSDCSYGECRARSTPQKQTSDAAPIANKEANDLPLRVEIDNNGDGGEADEIVQYDMVDSEPPTVFAAAASEKEQAAISLRNNRPPPGFRTYQPYDNSTEANRILLNQHRMLDPSLREIHMAIYIQPTLSNQPENLHKCAEEYALFARTFAEGLQQQQQQLPSSIAVRSTNLCDLFEAFQSSIPMETTATLSHHHQQPCQQQTQQSATWKYLETNRKSTAMYQPAARNGIGSFTSAHLFYQQQQQQQQAPQQQHTLFVPFSCVTSTPQRFTQRQPSAYQHQMIYQQQQQQQQQHFQQQHHNHHHLRQNIQTIQYFNCDNSEQQQRLFQSTINQNIPLLDEQTLISLKKKYRDFNVNVNVNHDDCDNDIGEDNDDDNDDDDVVDDNDDVDNNNINGDDDNGDGEEDYTEE